MAFGPHVGTIMGRFWRALGLLGGILAAQGAPRPLPRALLGSLGVLKSLQATLMIDFGPT